MRKEIEEIAYGKRRKNRIYLRKIEYKLFSFYRNLFGLSKCDTVKIVIYPSFKDNFKMNDILNRVIWSYPVGCPFVIYYSADIDMKIENIPFQVSYLQKAINNGQINFNKVSMDELQQHLKDAKLVLVHDRKYRYQAVTRANGRNTIIIDPWYYSLEECNGMKFGLYNIIPKNIKEEFIAQSKNNYKSFKNKNKDKSYSYIFVTGPSFSSYNQLTYKPNSLKIVCNTIVKDKEFLEFIGGPDLICFCDPAFHFSVNDYACKFRELVLDCVRKYDSYVAVPQSCVPLLTYNYPDIRDRIIGLRRSDTFNIPSENNLSVKPTGSVITFMMIPFASSMTESVRIIGADGRGKSENYFWKHNNNVQLTELMESVYETHPSFFRDRVYSNHYNRHCKEMETIIELSESNGVDVRSLTPSFVPCLKERFLSHEK